MIIGIPVYQDVDLLDVTGPHEVLKWMDDAIDLRLIATTRNEAIKTRDDFTFVAPFAYDDVRALDVLWVPGGHPRALRFLMREEDGGGYLNFLRTRGPTAKFVCSVCEGALLLAKAGLLDGYEVTTHWQFIPCLQRFPNIRVAPGTPRFIHDRNRLTGGGISSGLDEAFKLVELLSDTKTAQGVQQIMQYYPDPPVTSTLPTANNCPFNW